MRIGTLFSGIGSPEQAAKRVYGYNHKLVFACEWDKYARESFKANYEIQDEHFHKDINDMDGTQYKDKVDILIGGSPCQDFSLAGLRAGVDGQKGILIYQYIRIIKEVQPLIFIYENVKGMLSDKKGKTIKEFVEAFRDLGYFCHYEVLNTKDYGVPQNRERIFLVGFKDKEHYYNFSFAPKIKLEKRLKDILEDNVDEKYYLNKPFELYNQQSQGNTLIDIEKTCNTLVAGTHGYSQGYIKEPTLNQIGTLDIKGNDSIKRVYSSDGLSPCLTTMGGGNREPKIAENIKPSVRANFERDYEKIINSDKDIFYCECDSGFQDNKVCLTESSCLRANNDNLFALDNEFRIRKLTPRECFRLQDFPDSFKFVVSNSQLYKQAGNSISVNMMEMIFKQIEASRYGNTNGGLF